MDISHAETRPAHVEVGLLTPQNDDNDEEEEEEENDNNHDDNNDENYDDNNLDNDNNLDDDADENDDDFDNDVVDILTNGDKLKNGVKGRVRHSSLSTATRKVDEKVFIMNKSSEFNGSSMKGVKRFDVLISFKATAKQLAQGDLHVCIVQCAR